MHTYRLTIIKLSQANHSNDSILLLLIMLSMIFARAAHESISNLFALPSIYHLAIYPMLLIRRYMTFAIIVYGGVCMCVSVSVCILHYLTICCGRVKLLLVLLWRTSLNYEWHFQ